jgi:hypothetical protein
MQLHPPLLFSRSGDCLNTLIPTVFSDSTIGRKYSSARTKIEAIICGVLAPLSLKELLEEMKDRPFSLMTDASNHKALKLFPVVVRYFSEAGIQVKLLQLSNLPGDLLLSC